MRCHYSLMVFCVFIGACGGSSQMLPPPEPPPIDRQPVKVTPLPPKVPDEMQAVIPQEGAPQLPSKIMIVDGEHFICAPSLVVYWIDKFLGRLSGAPKPEPEPIIIELQGQVFTCTLERSMNK